MISPASPVPDILTRLRSETRNEHDAIEAALDLTDHELTIERYRKVLARFYGFYRPLEDRIRGVEGCGLDLRERAKTPVLRADLETLGVPTESLPLCAALPEVGSPADAFGCLYVLEGATLGGRVISRHIATVLGITPKTGGRFFDGYGGRTGEMWQSFRQTLLEHAVAADEPDSIVISARATFRSLGDWFRENEQHGG